MYTIIINKVYKMYLISFIYNNVLYFCVLIHHTFIYTIYTICTICTICTI